ncbi:nitrilase-related carbon-nitrogen hydrolase [Candidatus Latescibacterota bacterium]
MKIGFVQFRPEFGNPAANVKTMTDMISSVEADLLVLPELATTGYTFTSKDEIRDMAEEFETSESLGILQEVAAKQSCALVVGFGEKSGNKIFNSAALLRPDGSRALHRKNHLFGAEKKFFDLGDLPFAVHEYEGVSLAMIVCFDWYFPESIRVLALRGAQIICQPANLVLKWCQRAMVIRSIENRVFTVTANRYGFEKSGKYSFTFTGESQITSPEGEILISAPKEGDYIEVVEIDPNVALDKNINRMNNLFEDRRPELYGDIAECDSRQ